MQSHRVNVLIQNNDDEVRISEVRISNTATSESLEAFLSPSMWNPGNFIEPGKFATATLISTPNLPFLAGENYIASFTVIWDDNAISFVDSLPFTLNLGGVTTITLDPIERTAIPPPIPAAEMAVVRVYISGHSETVRYLYFVPDTLMVDPRTWQASVLGPGRDNFEGSNRPLGLYGRSNVSFWDRNMNYDLGVAAGRNNLRNTLLGNASGPPGTIGVAVDSRNLRIRNNFIDVVVRVPTGANAYRQGYWVVFGDTNWGMGYSVRSPHLQNGINSAPRNTHQDNRAFWISPSILTGPRFQGPSGRHYGLDETYVYVNNGRMVNTRNFSTLPRYDDRPRALVQGAAGATSFRVIPIHYDTSQDRAAVLKKRSADGIMEEDWLSGTRGIRPNLTGNFQGTNAPVRPREVNGTNMTGQWSPARGWVN
jgi:hypothetical protein